MSKLNSILVIGSGGREFALIQEALKAGVKTVYSSRELDAVNIGIESVINIGVGKSTESIIEFVLNNKLDLVIVGPEAALVNGVAKMLRETGVPVYGPDPDGARFEADKTVTHDFVKRHGLPNPPHSETFDPSQRNKAKSLIKKLGPSNIYTKRVGLEGGKGARGYSKNELQAALNEVDEVADKGEKLLIQGRLFGPEYSAMFMLDGKGNMVSTALARDHKSLLNGGLGPNTGGIGAFAPLNLEQASLERRREIEKVGKKIAKSLVKDGIDYRGTIYVGFMAETSDPKSPLHILEFNVRFGDPETQVIINSLNGRILDYIYKSAVGSLEYDASRLYFDLTNGPVTLTVCLASPGYPEGDIITGLPINVPKNLPKDISLQFAGAKIENGVLVSNGGRVLYVTKTASTLAEARKVYDFIGRENNGIYIGDNVQVIRTDIGLI